MLTLFASNLFVLSFILRLEITFDCRSLCIGCAVASPTALVTLIGHVLQLLIL